MKRAFSLLELLAVIAVVAALAVVAMPSLRGLGGGQSVTGSVVILSGILQNARQEAVTKNHYIGVALGNDGDTLWVTTFAAADGQRFDWSSGIALPSDTFQLTAAPRSFAKTLLKNSGDLKPSSLPEPDVDTVNINPLAEASVTVSVSGKNLRLNRLLMFTPSGQALTDAELNQFVEFGIVSARDTENKDPAVFRVSGNLGAVTVYRN